MVRIRIPSAVDWYAEAHTCNHIYNLITVPHADAILRMLSGPCVTQCVMLLPVRLGELPNMTNPLDPKAATPLLDPECEEETLGRPCIC